MKLKELEMFLQDIEGFRQPKIQYEQYNTGHHIGARMLFSMNSFDDIEHKSILDLGIGCGRLGIGCAFLGASYVLGIDIDSDALAQCAENCSTIRDDSEDESMLTNLDLIQGDICDDQFCSKLNQRFQVVVMNPPFGTKNNKGIDMLFLKRGIDVALESVYSLHKTSTREHILKKCADWRVKKVEILAQLRYDLPNSYVFHKKRSKDIEVDFYRIEK
ncbi:hypothetical protein RDWZM_006773 [Blomia tropicalis]|uniref:Methyltransferase small domain-containing protein n=1 Tax=Blomia tropicalis TaxID=40697 RepID=A0A9Q0RPM0_BLOTA|nr:Methyltransferase-like protein 5 [Blomia tropicalis]KAJ6220961.1 hypothetical protein RDWZM_006773 [Blomia tropicalis]